MDDHHELVAKHLRYSNNPDETRQEMLERIATQVALCSHAERVAFLQEIDDAIEKDTSSLREHAKLLSLHRAVSHSHEKLKAVGK